LRRGRGGPEKRLAIELKHLGVSSKGNRKEPAIAAINIVFIAERPFKKVPQLYN
jgi:hypothetical protein